jgi:putrescine aminotransferase
VIVEPVQGEAGVIVPPSRYLSDVARACAERDALLVVDEVQTGLGRLGWWWAIERSGVVPDVLLAGKALGGGVVPVSALAARTEVFAPFRRDPRQAASTFGGYPLGAAALIATIDVLRRESLVERARGLGDALSALLSEACAPAIEDGVLAETRGLGLLHGLEFRHPRSAKEFAAALLEAGVVPSYSSASSTTVRLTPPATLSDDELGVLRGALAQAADAVVGAKRPAVSGGVGG